MATPSSRTKQLTLVASILGTTVVTVDSTVVNVALPAIADDLGGGLAGQQWTANAYLVTLGSLLLIGGSLGDIFGERRVFAFGVAAFGVTSLACALAPTIEILVAARALQGVAGALLTPAALAVIVANFAPDERGKAVGAWTAWGGVGTVLGPLIGGQLVDAAWLGEPVGRGPADRGRPAVRRLPRMGGPHPSSHAAARPVQAPQLRLREHRDVRHVRRPGAPVLLPGPVPPAGGRLERDGRGHDEHPGDAPDVRALHALRDAGRPLRTAVLHGRGTARDRRRPGALPAPRRRRRLPHRPAPRPARLRTGAVDDGRAAHLDRARRRRRVERRDRLRGEQRDRPRGGPRCDRRCGRGRGGVVPGPAPGRGRRPGDPPRGGRRRRGRQGPAARGGRGGGGGGGGGGVGAGRGRGRVGGGLPGRRRDRDGPGRAGRRARTGGHP